jgi:hypothetical protein
LNKNWSESYADLQWAGVSAQKFIRKAELPKTKTLSSNHETLPIAIALLTAAVFQMSFIAYFYLLSILL